MPRLPIPGDDQGNWGHLLNNFLRQAHSDNGKLNPGSVDRISVVNGSINRDKLSQDIIEKIDTIGSVDWASIINKPATYQPSSHNHDDRYVNMTSYANSRQTESEGIMIYNGIAWPPRISGYVRVIWVGGAVRPIGMIAGDIWEHDS